VQSISNKRSGNEIANNIDNSSAVAVVARLTFEALSASLLLLSE
jgi:hypothetical protein